ncbi:MAG: hypothetical protein IVW36_03065 [Dehalococcoidia bacterium]|nr:hypothetical protein [Dehalococcoidia bacterium]
MTEALRWWLILQLAGGILLPLCLVLFRRLPDRGYTLSKPFGLLFLGYAFWLLNSLHVIPNSSGGIVFALLVLAIIAGAFAYGGRGESLAWLRAHWRYIAAVETLLLVVFLVAVWLRMQVGAIGGTEQPMDLMLVNATTRAAHFPPQDPWLSGRTVAYYYFGYLIVAMVGRMAGTATEVSYNLGLAMVAALALVGAAGLAYNLIRMHESAAAEPDAPGAEDGFAADDSGDHAPLPPASAPPPMPAPVLVAQRSQGAAREAFAETATMRPPSPSKPQRAAAPGAAGIPLSPQARASLASAWKRVRGPSVASAWASVRAPAFGLAAGLMLVIMGNLVGVLQFMSAYGIGSRGFFRWLDVQGLTTGIPRHSWYPSNFFGFFNASRIYPLDQSGGRVITEFPMFSFILGDLHPHVMALPFVLLAVAVALAFYRSPDPLDVTFWIRRPLALVAAGIVVGGLAFLNTWDIATLTFVVVAAAALSNFIRVRALTLDLLVQVVTFALPLLIAAVVLYLPFYASFTSQASGIGAVVSNRSVTVPGTRPVQAFLFWAPLFAITLPFVGSRLIAARERITLPRVVVAIVPSVVVVVGWVLVFGYEKAVGSSKLNGAPGLLTQIGDRGSAWWTDAFFAAVLSAALLALWLEATSREERGEREGPLFTLGLIATALLLVLGTEFFYVGDVFNSRMNTVFKLYYQAWLLLAVAGGFALYYIVTRWRWSSPRAATYRYAWGAIAVVFILAAGLYSAGGTMDRIRQYEGDQLATPVDTLDGLVAYDASDRAGIDFLKQQAQGQGLVIAESVCPVPFAQCTGDDYSYASRVSGATGIPTILGWAGHEDQWRGGTAKARAGRFEDVNELYTTTDMARVAAIVKKYGVTYIYVGQLERTAYGQGVDKFASMPVAFQSGAVTIYRATIPTGEVQTTP